VDKQNRIYVGQTLVTLDDLNTRLRAMLSENKQLRLVIRGDKDVNYGAIVDVARLAADIGITKMALATSAPE
jgi:biopolymer transport protein TolR